MFQRSAVVVLLFAVAVTAMAFQSQPEKRNTITVMGTGKVKFKPDTVILTFKVSGSAEEAVSAEKKHADKLKRVQEALTKLDLKDGGVNIQSIAIATGVTKGDERQAYYGGGGGAQQAMPEVAMATTLRATLKGINPDDHADVARKVAAVLDAAVVAGAENKGSFQYSRQYGTYMPVANSPAVAFVLSDEKTAQVKDKALAAAVEEARKKAEKLAVLLGRKLGKAVTLTEGDSTLDRASVEVKAGQVVTATSVVKEDIESFLAEKEHSASVSVTFELAD